MDIILDADTINPAIPSVAVDGFVDTFNRPNGPLGVTADGLPWVVFEQTAGGTTAVVSAQGATVSSTTGRVTAVIDSGLLDGTLTAVLRSGITGSAANICGGLAFRMHGASTGNVLWVMGDGTLRFQTLVSGTATTVNSSAGVYVAGRVITITMNAANVTVRVDGVTVITTTSTVGYSTPSPRHGIMGHTTTAPAIWEGVSFDA